MSPIPCCNRHCPKCQWSAATEWLLAREAELLPVSHFHVVFTLPAEIGAIADQNKAKVYGLLFKAAADTLTTIAADPKHLGADIGFIAVLHSWGQNLDHHPHVHCIVPAGGISATVRSGFDAGQELLSVGPRALTGYSGDCSRNACGVLYALHRRGSPVLWQSGPAPKMPVRSVPTSLRCASASGSSSPNVPLRARRQVLTYLARYTHRVAISNSRIISLADGKVCFRWKDYRQDGQDQVMTLTAGEFIRRFLMHTLPDGFHRIRHYGLFANGHRADMLNSV